MFLHKGCLAFDEAADLDEWTLASPPSLLDPGSCRSEGSGQDVRIEQARETPNGTYAGAPSPVAGE